MTPREDWPLVTLAIPLYRSRRFLEVIVANIEGSDYPNLEILVSDRHLADDTIEQLRAIFSDDHRVRYLAVRDELTWAAHYNALLEAANGEYFLWMPHDDSYPPPYIRSLVTRLHEVPEAIIAFGRMDVVSLDGTQSAAWESSPLHPGQPWTTRSALHLLFGWNLGLAMRGVVRRAPLIEADLWIRPTRGLVEADICWLFGVALLGPYEYVASASCLKRFYADSTHASWASIDFLDRTRVLASYVDSFAPSMRARTAATAFLWLAYAYARAAQLTNKVSGRRISGSRLPSIVLRMLR